MMDKSLITPETPAEIELLSVAKTGEIYTFDKGILPVDADTNGIIRGTFLRAILLDAVPDFKLHEKGLRLKGLRIEGTFDLQGVTCEYDILFSQCFFEKRINLLNAKLQGLSLDGSFCPGVIADQTSFDGSVFLRNGFETAGEIAMPGAQITGDLQICDAVLNSNSEYSLFATSVIVDGSVYLGDYPFDDIGTDLQATGFVTFASATIKRDFHVENVSISASDTVTGTPSATMTAFANTSVLLSLLRARIGGVFRCRNNQFSGGYVDMAGANIRRLNDDPVSASTSYVAKLNGLEYEDFSQEANISITSRLAWLENRPDGVVFSGQPFEQFARVLTKMGHQDEAGSVLLRKEHLQRKLKRQFAAQEKKIAWRVPFMWFTDTVLYYLVGYGYRPIYVFFWTSILVLAIGLMFQKTWNAGDMAPNSAPILISKDWISATQMHSDNPAKFWSSRGQAGQDYETYNAFAYAADLLIPIVDLGQEKAWAPSTSRSPWGQQAWWMRWFAKAIGWVMTALGAATVTGLIRRD